MSSTFGALGVAASGLYAAQRGVDVTGQNISNVNTDGYSRQRVDLQSVGASAVPAIWSTNDGIGAGVDSGTVTRIRDAFLESRAQVEHANSSQLTAEDGTYTQVQQAFGEPGTTGIQSQLSDMWSAWQDLATHAGDGGAGNALIQSTQTLVDGLHSTRAALDTQWTQTQSNLQALVSDVNATATSIAKLNSAISLAGQAGKPTNELSDQRDSLVLHLSEQIGATTQPAPDGSLNVVVGGVSLVSGQTALALAVAGPTSPDNTSTTPVAPTDPNFMTTGMPRIVTSAGHTTLVAGGTAGGQLNALNQIIPTYRSQLDAVAKKVADQVNAAQTAGYDGSGNTGASTTPIFGSTSGPITAASITLLVSDPKQIAASAVAPDANGAAVNGGNADAIAQLGSAVGSPDDDYRSMITQLGVQAASTSRGLQIQTTVTSTVDNDRESVSGVDLDEEMTNMLSYQHAYSASARLITAIDQNLDTLINHMGLVGNA